MKLSMINYQTHRSGGAIMIRKRGEAAGMKLFSHVDESGFMSERLENDKKGFR